MTCETTRLKAFASLVALVEDEQRALDAWTAELERLETEIGKDPLATIRRVLAVVSAWSEKSEAITAALEELESLGGVRDEGEARFLVRAFVDPKRWPASMRANEAAAR